MRIRFLKSLREGAGPQYNAGEEAEMPDEKAADWITRGWVAPAAPSPAPPQKDVPAPPVDKMLRGPGKSKAFVR